MNPVSWYNNIKNVKQNTSNSSNNSLNNEELEKAKISQQAYQSHSTRNNIGDWNYNKDLSGDSHAVYSHKNNANDSNTNNQHILSFKGTNNKNDIVPDLHIAAGTQDKNNEFQKSAELFSNLKQKYKGNWQTTGHSLGGAKAMWAAQQYMKDNPNETIDSHSFNPGYVSFSDDRINTNRQGNHVYVIKGDPISNSILTTKVHHIKTLPNKSKYNPIKNHSIDSFIN